MVTAEQQNVRLISLNTSLAAPFFNEFGGPVRTSFSEAEAIARVLWIAILVLLVSGPAAAQDCQMCSSADACIQTYLKAASLVQWDTKQAIRDWKQNLDSRASGELFSKGTVALQGAMESQVRSELERLKGCLAKVK
jgi:hypothetical protein